MVIRSLRLRSFRNLKDQSVDLNPGVSVFVGNNGQGKTNFLEAIHLLSTLKSFRSIKLKEIVQHRSPSAEISSTFESDGLPLALRLKVDKSGRSLWVGDNPVSKLIEYLGLLKVVAFTPDDLAMVKGSPANRRRFLDRSAFLFTASHLDAARGFNSALKLRNRLLNQEGSLDRLQLQCFTQALANLGSQVSINRAAVLARISSWVGSVYRHLYPDAAVLENRFKPGWSMKPGATGDDLYAELMNDLERDRQRRSTSVGPQQDDFEALLDEYPVRRYASQGQQRATAVSLLLAVFMALVEEGQEPPVILLDDVSSELDKNCRNRLFEKVLDLGGQVLVTTTDESLIDSFNPVDRFSVVDGFIKKLP